MNNQMVILEINSIRLMDEYDLCFVVHYTKMIIFLRRNN